MKCMFCELHCLWSTLSVKYFVYEIYGLGSSLWLIFFMKYIVKYIVYEGYGLWSTYGLKYLIYEVHDFWSALVLKYMIYKVHGLLTYMYMIRDEFCLSKTWTIIIRRMRTYNDLILSKQYVCTYFITSLRP